MRFFHINRLNYSQFDVGTFASEILVFKKYMKQTEVTLSDLIEI